MPLSKARQFAGLAGTVVSVKGFGAVGDGVTDDAAAFNRTQTENVLAVIQKPPTAYTFATSVSTTTGAWLPDPTIAITQLTDGGNFNMARGHYVSDTNSANIWRFTDRLFVGNAATSYGGGPSPDSGTGWLASSADGPHYLLSNATLIAMPNQRRYGIVGAASTGHSTVGSGSAIGIGAIAINDAGGANAAPAWAFITEAQHETVDAKTWGIEIALKNASGASTTAVPYASIPTNMTTGILLAGGGDDSFGPVATHACTAGIVFSTGNNTGWNSGIVFREGSIPTNNAIEMPYNYRLAWYDSTGTQSAQISASNNTPGSFVRLNLGPNNFNFMVNNGKPILYVTGSATDVNRVQINGAVTGNHPQITADGDDTNIDLRLLPKGTGNIRFGTWTSNADAAVNGYVTIKDSAGNTRKLATIA